MNVSFTRIAIAAIFACALLGAAGCANRQVIDSALNQALTNNALLAKEQASQTQALMRATESNKQLAASVRAMVEADCRRLNTGRATYAQARKEALAHKLRTQFDDAAFEAMDQFTTRFNEVVAAPLRTQLNKASQELTAFQSSERKNDRAQSVKIAEKRQEMTGIVLEIAKQNVQLRDKLINALTAERARFAATVDSQLAAIQMPTENCDELATTFEAATAALGTQADALRTYDANVQALYASQEDALEAVRAYANRVTFYKLVLQGAKDSALERLRDLSSNVDKAIVNAQARLDVLLDKATSSVTAGLTKFESDLDGRATSLSDTLRSAIDSTRAGLGNLAGGSARTVSNAAQP